MKRLRTSRTLPTSFFCSSSRVTPAAVVMFVFSILRFPTLRQTDSSLPTMFSPVDMLRTLPKTTRLNSSGRNCVSDVDAAKRLGRVKSFEYRIKENAIDVAFEQQISYNRQSRGTGPLSRRHHSHDALST